MSTTQTIEKPITIKSDSTVSNPLEVLSSKNTEILARFYEGTYGLGNMMVTSQDGQNESRISAGHYSYINSRENVGIGTKEPTEKLDVKGTVQGTAFKIIGIENLGALPAGNYPLAINPETGEVICYVP